MHVDEFSPRTMKNGAYVVVCVGAGGKGDTHFGKKGRRGLKCRTPHMGWRGEDDDFWRRGAPWVGGAICPTYFRLFLPPPPPPPFFLPGMNNSYGEGVGGVVVPPSENVVLQQWAGFLVGEGKSQDR